MKSKYINDWICDCCGELQSKHNQYFDGVCEVCFVNSLTKEEQEYIAKLRVFFKKDNGLDKISGGFCRIDVESFYSDTLFCKVLLGSSDDVGSYTKDFIIEVNRNKLDFDFIY